MINDTKQFGIIANCINAVAELLGAPKFYRKKMVMVNMEDPRFDEIKDEWDSLDEIEDEWDCKADINEEREFLFRSSGGYDGGDD
jgi:hypothetical protein